MLIIKENPYYETKISFLEVVRVGSIWLIALSHDPVRRAVSEPGRVILPFDCERDYIKWC